MQQDDTDSLESRPNGESCSRQSPAPKPWKPLRTGSFVSLVSRSTASPNGTGRELGIRLTRGPRPPNFAPHRAGEGDRGTGNHTAACTHNSSGCSSPRGRMKKVASFPRPVPAARTNNRIRKFREFVSTPEYSAANCEPVRAPPA